MFDQLQHQRNASIGSALFASSQPQIICAPNVVGNSQVQLFKQHSAQLGLFDRTPSLLDSFAVLISSEDKENTFSFKSAIGGMVELKNTEGAVNIAKVPSGKREISGPASRTPSASTTPNLHFVPTPRSAATTPVAKNSAIALIRGSQDNFILKKTLAQWLIGSDLMHFVSFPLSYWAETINGIIKTMTVLFEDNQISKELLLSAIMNTDNYINGNGLTHERIHLLIASFLVCFKFWCDDEAECNLSFSKLAGVDIAEFNEIERQFLQGIDYKLSVTEDEMEAYLRSCGVEPHLEPLLASIVNLLN